MSFKKYIKKSIIPLSVLSLVLFVSFDSPSDRYFAIAKNMEIYTSVYSEVNKYYVDEVDPNSLMKEGIDAMLKSLDPYTNYIPEDDIEDFRFLSTGQYGGIGAIIGTRNDRVLVLMPYTGFPAHEAGLKIADEIVEVDGVDIRGKNTSEVSKLLKGQAGTSVSIKIKRPNQEDLVSLDINREKIKVKNVPYYGMVNDHVGYLALRDFTREASDEVRNALEELKKQGADSYILDLRSNPGGLLNEAINISNLFVPKGKEIVSTKGKIDKWNAVYKADQEPFDTEVPLAILTNQRSASASEIVSGVIQDYDRGVLIGQRTYGKGLVQATLPLVHNSQLKVTTAKYYIPSGRCIQAIDYSNRNEDGSLGKIPDSLQIAFKTKNGRIVYDGGGVIPDILVTKENMPEVARGLAESHLLFEYATKYYYSHDTVKDPKNFSLTNAEYMDFVDWVEDQDFNYQTEAEETFNEFIAKAEADSAYVGLTDEIIKFKKKIQDLKKNDLLVYKKTIRELLEEEISSRYFFQEGIIESSFDNDNDIMQAVQVLEDRDRYNKILSGKK